MTDFARSLRRRGCRVGEARRESGAAAPPRARHRPDAPLFGVVSRLTPQKGLDLLLACLPEFIADGRRLAILGSRDSDLEHGFSAAAATHHGEIVVEIGYDEALSHLIIAGADIVLVPSRFEPCGLTQLYALALRHVAAGAPSRRPR